MSDFPRPQTPNNVTDIRDKVSPPPSPSSPSYNDPEMKSSRKREREVSLEPVTTPKASANDSDPFLRDHKDIRTPAKKNKTHLDSTAEEEDISSGSGSNSPPDEPSQGTSSPQELKIKVRQISQGVEDLSWKNLKGTQVSQEDVSVPQDPNQIDNNGHEADTMNTEEYSPSTSAEIKINDEASSAKGDAGVSDGLSTAHEGSITRRDSGSDSGEKEKGLKRKYLERGTSAGPQDGEGAKSVAEPVKRPRDDADEDANPRETKRPTPPPDSEKAAAPKLSGFMAYASASSPFASVKGQNIFSSSSKSSTPSSSKSATPPTIPSPSPLATPGEPSTSSSSTSVKRSGFEAFASSSSPFATAAARTKSPPVGSASRLGRPKSPQRRSNATSTSAFSAYASGGVQSFALPLQKRPRAGSPSSSSSLERNSTVGALGAESSALDSGADDDRDDRPSSFGEKLRAGKDEDEQSEDEQPKIVLSEQEVTTGEEEEETIHQVRGKLYALADGAWKERGTGLLKLNVRASDGGGARLVMRKEAVYTVLLNVTLFHGMRCELAQDPRYLRFSVIEGGITTHYNLRLANAKIAQELMEEIHGNLPSSA